MQDRLFSTSKKVLSLMELTYMNWKNWDHVIKNKKGHIVFSGKYEDCVSFFLAGSGARFGWSLSKYVPTF